MRIRGGILNFLARLDWRIRKGDSAHEAKPSRMLDLYAYYCGAEEDPIRDDSVVRDIGLYKQSMRRHREALEELGLIRVSSGSKNMKHVEILDVFSLSLSSSYCTTYRILYGSKSKSSKSGRRQTDLTTDDFSLDDIKNDEDWQRVEPILKKYFRDHQIDPERFFSEKAIAKHYWRKFNDILEDSSVDFEEYCKWYRVNKYPRLKFTYGAFVLPSMVDEFKEDSEPDSYKDISKKSFEKDIAKSKDFLDQFDKGSDVVRLKKGKS